MPTITNTIMISCELLEALRRISVTVTYADCYCCQPITVIGDSPVVVSDLVAGQYIVEMAIADTTEISDTIVETITVSGDDKSSISSTNVKMITPTDTCTTTMHMVAASTNDFSSTSKGICT